MHWVINLGILAGALTAILTLIRLATGWNPAEWLFRKLVSEPAKDGVRHVVREEVIPLLHETLGQLSPNSGTSFYDRIDQRFTGLEDKVDERCTRIETRLSAVEDVITSS